MKIFWKATKRQELALIQKVDELLFGGARGGGKSTAGTVWLIEPKYISNKHYRGLVIRRNADDLRDWVDRAREMYRPCNAVFVGSPAEIRFPSGAKIRTGHLKDENAYTKYQGHEYQKILMEELTHIQQEGNYEKLLGSCRSTVEGLKPRVFATTNPDGDGFFWVRERFDCENADEKIREFKDEETGIVKTRLFIPAKVEDNPHLMEKDPGYVAFLNSIKDETLRRQWREGSWEEPKIEGAYYAKQIKLAEEENRITRVRYDLNLPVHTFWDLGMNDRTVIWFMQNIGNEYRFIDYYEAEGEGFEFYKKILDEKNYIYGEHYAPHDIAVREMGTGKSRLEVARGLGINFRMVAKLHIDDGINAVRGILDRCWFDKEKCKEGLRALKFYRKEYDEKMQCWKSKPLHNWAADAADSFRYFAVGYRRQIQRGKKKGNMPGSYF